MTDPIRLAAGAAAAEISPLGAEPMAWRIGERQLLWSGDPAHWNRRAPILFPVVGASAGGVARVGRRAFPMPRHGFARDCSFALVDRDAARVRLRLTDGEATRAHYPFAFALEVEAALSPSALALAFTVTNPGGVDLPYALGFHPAFPWPFAGGSAEDYRVVFDADQNPGVPDLTPDGLLREGSRRLPLGGAVLPLTGDLFARDALVMRDVQGRSMRFTAPDGAALAVEAEDFPHFALWTKPGAPFLSLETWTGHADPEGFSGEMAEKPSIRILPPGGHATHRTTLRFGAGT
ncbi:aldose 1-epimerase family protein [Salinarimonas soli]|uniref:Aldose 1-epimerase family protein n=1 Tax=Salinarimonas soli TaxID=1638099 RepID=A0A5B2V5Y1_9HYPH|nr:aldose 1-epimerase family protein [Salinarimonas soli]KAA2234394.1 aldose 1-epimerase family protein [Salinarimonas soli]